jgi:hypothetical protein
VQEDDKSEGDGDNDKSVGDGDNDKCDDGDNGDDAAEAQFNMLYKQYRETGAIMVPELHFACIPFASLVGGALREPLTIQLPTLH